MLPLQYPWGEGLGRTAIILITTIKVDNRFRMLLASDGRLCLEAGPENS